MQSYEEFDLLTYTFPSRCIGPRATGDASKYANGRGEDAKKYAADEYGEDAEGHGMYEKY